MKIKDRFIIYNADGEQIMVTTGGKGFNGIVKNNKTAAFIIECLKEDTTKAEILDKMVKKYDAPKEIIDKDISELLDKLREIGAIDE